MTMSQGKTFDEMEKIWARSVADQFETHGEELLKFVGILDKEHRLSAEVKPEARFTSLGFFPGTEEREYQENLTACFFSVRTIDQLDPTDLVGELREFKTLGSVVNFLSKHPGRKYPVHTGPGQEEYPLVVDVLHLLSPFMSAGGDHNPVAIISRYLNDRYMAGHWPINGATLQSVLDSLPATFPSTPLPLVTGWSLIVIGTLEQIAGAPFVDEEFPIGLLNVIRCNGADADYRGVSLYQTSRNGSGVMVEPQKPIRPKLRDYGFSSPPLRKTIQDISFELPRVIFQDTPEVVKFLYVHEQVSTLQQHFPNILRGHSISELVSKILAALRDDRGYEGLEYTRDTIYPTTEFYDKAVHPVVLLRGGNHFEVVDFKERMF